MILTIGDAKSWFLYPRTKGKLEQDIIALGFNTTSIFRPGLLLFDGERSQPRFLERCAVSLAKTLGISYGSVRVEQVAKSMKIVAERPEKPAVCFYENNEILKMI